MTTAELVSEECVEDWNAQQMLQTISDEVRSIAPEGCCVHGDPFCLSCGLNWAVEQNVPLRLGN
jgi:hypothetical protein